MILMSLKTVSESSGSSRFVSHSVVAGDVTLALGPVLQSGMAVDAEEFEEDVDDEEADCGKS